MSQRTPNLQTDEIRMKCREYHANDPAVSHASSS